LKSQLEFRSNCVIICTTYFLYGKSKIYCKAFK